ncbi:Putative RxLR effector [Phytophthora palmivora]|uniref:RxLR effector protein n=1 Tax=Phytophthora palmivora TaxID=4796 RepID=A0A2P4XQF7_9STRA|nr:Putative RxLR effector [Phytophthora palmivora]
MRFSFVLLGAATTLLASSDAVFMASTSSGLKLYDAKSVVVDNKRLLRSASTASVVSDEDEERVLGIVRLFRGKKPEFDDPELTRQFNAAIGLFKGWNGKNDDQITEAIKKAVTKAKDRKNLRLMFDMFKEDGEAKLLDNLVAESKRLRGGRRS